MMEMEDRDLARMLGLGRALIGATMVLAPRKAARSYMGEYDPPSSTAMSLRGLGARDIALGTGLLIAVENDGEVSRWLEAGALADAGDFLATLANFRELPTMRRLLWLVTAGSATYLGLRLAGTLDR
jgi:hypothetical protein